MGDLLIVQKMIQIIPEHIFDRLTCETVTNDADGIVGVTEIMLTNHNGYHL